VPAGEGTQGSGHEMLTHRLQCSPCLRQYSRSHASRCCCRLCRLNATASATCNPSICNWSVAFVASSSCIWSVLGVPGGAGAAYSSISGTGSGSICLPGSMGKRTQHTTAGRLQIGGTRRLPSALQRPASCSARRVAHLSVAHSVNQAPREQAAATGLAILSIRLLQHLGAGRRRAAADVCYSCACSLPAGQAERHAANGPVSRCSSALWRAGARACQQGRAAGSLACSGGCLSECFPCSSKWSRRV
jgi:hypothetical protein